MPKYTRPGVEAAARLAKRTDDKQLWELIEGQYSDMILEKGGSTLSELDNFCESLGKKLQQNPYTLSKADLLEVINWKFTKGKPRHALKKLLNSNSEEDIGQAWNAAAAYAQSNAKCAIDSLSILKGVGPATASAFLSLYNPENFVFMDDEVIECLYEGKRRYTVKIYLDVNDKCITIANTLGWTPRRVGRALWTAARIQASGGNDLTVHTSNDTDIRKMPRSATPVVNTRTRKKQKL